MLLLAAGETASRGLLWDSFGVVAALLLVLLNGFFVAAEFALVRARPSQMTEMVEQGLPFADSAKWLADRLDGALSACQLGITIASLALGWIGEPAVASLLHPAFIALGIQSEAILHAVSFAVAFTAITALHVIIGELAPKTVAIRYAQTVARWCAPPLRAFWWLSYPILAALNGLTNAFLALFGIEPVGEAEDPHSEAEIRELVSVAREHGEVTTSERALIEGVFEFDDLISRKVMVPRVDVAFYDINEPMETFLELVRRTKHTRYPVCDGSLDNVLGVIHVKDIMLATDAGALDARELMRPPRFVPETLPISKLLRQFQATHQLLAIVVDEYGTTSGIVTLENVLEPIVGPVADEFDVESPEIVPESKGSFMVDGRVDVETVSERFGLALDDREADTLSGYVMARVGHVPEEGDTVDLDGATAEVIEVRKARAEKIRLTVTDKSDADQESGAEGEPSGEEPAAETAAEE